MIFSHRGNGFAREENTLLAFESAIDKGFSVEADLRIRDNRVILSHDEAGTGSNYEGLTGLLKLVKNNPGIFFALHIKDNSSPLYRKVAELIRPFKNCLIFVTDFSQYAFLEDIYEFSKGGQSALYVRDRKPDSDLLNKVDYLWLDEAEEKVYDDLGYFRKFNKKIICCSAELFSRDYAYRLAYLCQSLLKNKVFGVCTDFPDYYRTAQ